jgi:GT2 family glycosyltransferase
MESQIEPQVPREIAEKWPMVAIIVLNWNSWQDTIECLESIQKVDYMNLEAIVVDNASKDESVERISSWCNQNKIWCQQQSYNPDDLKIESTIKQEINDDSNIKSAIKQLILIKLSKNTGFCLGNNIGMKQAAANKAAFLLILNNDTIVTPTFLKPMVEIAQQDKNVGLVGGIICYSDNPDVIWFAGGSLDKYLECFLDHYGDLYSRVRFNSIINTGLVTGCMMLIPRVIYDRFGGFYEEFFIWSEDWEYSLRVKNAGYKLVLATKARIFHKCGRSLGIMKPLSYYYGTRNRMILKRMYLSRSNRWSFLAFFLLSRIPRYTYFALQGRWDLIRAGSNAIKDYFLGKTGKWTNHAD